MRPNTSSTQLYSILSLTPLFIGWTAFAGHYEFARLDCTNDHQAQQFVSELENISNSDEFHFNYFEPSVNSPCFGKPLNKILRSNSPLSNEQKSNYLGNALFAQRSSPASDSHWKTEASLAKWGSKKIKHMKMTPVEHLLMYGDFIDIPLLADLMSDALTIRLSQPITFKIPSQSTTEGSSDTPDHSVEIKLMSADLETLSDNFIEYQLHQKKLDQKYGIFDVYAAALMMGTVPAATLDLMIQKKMFFSQAPSATKRTLTYLWPFARAAAYRNPWTAGGAILIDLVSGVILTKKTFKQGDNRGTRLLR